MAYSNGTSGSLSGLIGGVGMNSDGRQRKNIKVAVLGASGGVGQSLSLMLKNLLPPGSVLALYDIVYFVKGIACDLSHIDTQVEVTYHEGTKQRKNKALLEACRGAQLVVITAGFPRKPGMTRDDLLNVNARIVRDLVEAVDEGTFVCIATNPVNSLIPLAAEVLRKRGIYDKRKLFGVTLLDSMRSCCFANRYLAPHQVVKEVPVVGGHSAQTIIPLYSLTNAGKYLTADQIEKLVDRVQNAGTEVVQAKEGQGSATLSMGSATAYFVSALVDALRGVRQPTVCAMVDMEATQAPYYMAWPVLVGREGIIRRVELEGISQREQELLKEMTPALVKEAARGFDVAKDILHPKPPKGKL